MRRRVAGVVLSLVLALTAMACQKAADPAPAAPAAADAEGTPAKLSALAPENLKKARPAPPFDLTGNWFIDTEDGKKPDNWRFGPPYPKLTPAAQFHFDKSAQ